MTQKVREQAGTAVEDQKTAVSDRINRVAEALHQTADCTDDQMVSRLLGQAAGRVESVSNYVRQHDMRDMYHEVERMARRHPAMFLGGMFVAGLLAARFLKASREHRSQEKPGQPGSGGEGHSCDIGAHRRIGDPIGAGTSSWEGS